MASSAASSSSTATLFHALPRPIHPKSPNFSISSLLIPFPKTPNSCLSTSIPLLGARLFSPWTSCKHLSVSIRQKYLSRERGKCRRRVVVYASLFGVGAPEALVIGVVALLVFGPKGLAEVARNLGKTLRAFQPTIRELQEVSREFKDSLQKEIGLDEIATTVKDGVNSTSTYRDEKPQAKVDSNGVPSINGESSSEDPLKATEQSTVPPEELQGEPNLSPAELLLSIQKGKTVAATTAEQPTEVPTETKPEPTPSSDEQPQASHETSGPPPLQKLESER